MSEVSTDRSMMNRVERTWIKSAMLLSSLAAGWVATFLTPEFRDIAVVARERRAAVAVRDSERPHASDMSRVRIRHAASRTM